VRGLILPRGDSKMVTLCAREYVTRNPSARGKFEEFRMVRVPFFIGFESKKLTDLMD
jgi:hypothetical protein